MPSIFDFLSPQLAGPTIARGRSQSMIPDPANPTQPLAPSMLDPMNNNMSGRDTLMGLSQGLLAAGGPSQYPVGMLDAFGKGVSGALSAREAGEDKHLKRALVSAQVQKATADIANDKAWQDMFKTPAASATAPVSSVTPPVGAPTPLMPGAGGGGPSNPNNPGNLSDGKGGFQTFKTPEDGVANAIKLAQEFPKRYNGGQPMTLAQIEAHWSPPDDGRDPMTRGNKQGVWSGNVARAMGIDPNIPLDFNNPQIGLAFAKAVHQAEHPPGTGYQPDVYQRGASLAYGLPAFSTPGAATPTQAMLPPPSAVPAGIPALAPGAIPPGTIAQPPVQLAGAPAGGPPGVPPQGDAAPAGGQQVAQAPPAAPQPQTLSQIIQNIPPDVRDVLRTMPRKEGMAYILGKYVDPEMHAAIDTQTGLPVFAPKNDKTGRYQPLDAARLSLDRERFDFEKGKFATETRRDENKFATEQKQKGQFVRGPDGTQRWVPATEYAGGMPNYDKPPEAGAPGTETGDVGTLSKAFNDPEFAKKPEYAAAYNRLSGKLIDGPGGLKYSPNMGAYPPPPAGTSQQQGASTGTAPPGMQQVGEKSYTETQNKDHTYATRLDNAIPQLEALVKGGKLPSSFDQKQANSPYFPESMVSDKAKEFRRVIKDIMTATLRRESGATIQDTEFTSEAQKFIPQPGDKPAEIERKLTALKLAARTIAEGSARDRNLYPNLFGGGASPAGSPAPTPQQGGQHFNYVPGKGLVPQ